jgi:hypothetical protein
MNERLLKFEGVAAALVLSLGLLITGVSMPPGHDLAGVMRWMGAIGLVFGLVMMAVMMSQSPARKMLFIAIGAMIYAGFFVYNAASNEITGTATYHSNVLWWGDMREAVTRDISPVKFRKVTNYLWSGGGLCFGISLVSFTLSRKSK